MKTLLFAPCIVDTEDRLLRYTKWLEYYTPLKDKLGYTDILLVDNASPPEMLVRLEQQFPEVIIIKKKVRLELFKPHGYGFWYRAMANGYKYAMDNNYDKVIHLDSDVYLFTDRICDFIKNTNTGYVTMFSKMYGFPECNIHILGKDKMAEAEQFMREDFLAFYPNAVAENRIPWTEVNKDFNGDRWSERGKLIQEDNWDYSCQTVTSMEMTFKGKL